MYRKKTNNNKNLKKQQQKNSKQKQNKTVKIMKLIQRVLYCIIFNKKSYEGGKKDGNYLLCF